MITNPQYTGFALDVDGNVHSFPNPNPELSPVGMLSLDVYSFPVLEAYASKFGYRKSLKGHYVRTHPETGYAEVLIPYEDGCIRGQPYGEEQEFEFITRESLVYILKNG